MNEIKTLDIVRLSAGRLELSDAQAGVRKHMLVEREDGVYEIHKAVEFKAGEVFGFDGDIPTPWIGTKVEIVSAVECEEAENREDENERIALIVEAIQDLDEDDETKWTKQGKPEVAAIEEILGSDITAAERDQAWKLLK